MQSLLATSFTEARLGPAIDDRYAQVEAAGKGDWHKFGWERNDWFEAGPDRIKAWLADRRNFLSAEIDGYCDGAKNFLLVNEVMPENQSTLCDPDEPNEGNCHEPWFELYNAGLEPVSLQGFFLTTDPALPAMFRIDQRMIAPPLGHVIFWADGETAQGPNHTSFRLRSAAGVIGLYAPDGTTLVDSLAYALPPPGRSWGRTPDGAAASAVMTFASPGSRNRYAPAITVVEPRDQKAEEGRATAVAVELASNNDVTAVDLYFAAATTTGARGRWRVHAMDATKRPSPHSRWDR